MGPVGWHVAGSCHPFRVRCPGGCRTRGAVRRLPTLLLTPVLALAPLLLPACSEEEPSFTDAGMIDADTTDGADLTAPETTPARRAGRSLQPGSGALRVHGRPAGDLPLPARRRRGGGVHLPVRGRGGRGRAHVRRARGQRVRSRRRHAGHPRLGRRPDPARHHDHRGAGGARQQRRREPRVRGRRGRDVHLRGRRRRRRAPPRPWPSPASPMAPHSVVITATDRAGNVEVEPARHDWVLDSAAPDTVIDSGPTGLVMTATATFTFSSPDAGPGRPSPARSTAPPSPPAPRRAPTAGSRRGGPHLRGAG